MAYVGDTLFVRHLPKSFTIEEREDFLKQFGATTVKCMSDNGNMKCSAFASFCNEESAQNALQRLHQLEVLGCRIVVQYAHRSFDSMFPTLPDPSGVERTITDMMPIKETSRQKMQEFGRNLNSIAQQFSLLYPISPKWKYRYPPPSPSILANISAALVSNPKLYTQVLHLMNKMNLPPPFGATITNAIIFPDELEIGRPRNVDIASGESEMESDEEHAEKLSGDVELKRPKKRITVQRKRQKLQMLVPKTSGPKDTASLGPSDVFETTGPQTAKKIEIKMVPSLPAQPEKAVVEDVEIESREGEEKEDAGFISRKELDANRIGDEEMRKLSVYKNYNAGEPSTRLYLKNIAKQVEPKDLNFIYGRYVNFTSATEKEMFDIRVMQGPMRGQAFVTLPNLRCAEDARKETNGYVLMGKPIVAQFAKIPKSSQAD